MFHRRDAVASEEKAEDLYLRLEGEIKKEIEKDKKADISVGDLFGKKEEDSYNVSLLKRLRRTRENYIALKARYKNESPEKALETAKDWADFLSAISTLKTAMQILHVDFEEDAHDKFEEYVRDAKVVAKELEKKFEREARR